MGALRRLATILLLLFFGLPPVSPLFASPGASEAGVAVCCRKGGEHHCLDARAFGNEAGPQRASFTAEVAKCPYAPAVLGGVGKRGSFQRADAVGMHLALPSHGVVSMGNVADRRVGQVAPRQMRGPPGLFV